jgi:hypothetical protein
MRYPELWIYWMREVLTPITQWEWKQFQRPPRQCVKSVIRGYVLFDGRNISDPKRLRPRASNSTASAGTKENK